MKQPNDGALIELFDDDGAVEASAFARAPAPWKVLVVDDDEEVHAATRFALQGARILNRPLALISARSAAEAREALAADRHVAVILLDVVMEEHDAGLKFAEWVRAQGYTSQRIILRTGQPGYAPEMDVIRNYDINDYRSKSELTQTRLLTAMTAAIRSYEQIETIEQSRRGLEMIVASCNQLFKEREFGRFSEGVLLQLASLMGARREGLICAGRADAAGGDLHIVSGVGALSQYVGACLGDLPDDDFANAVRAYAVEGRAEPVAPAPRRPGVMFSVATRPDRRYLTCIDHDAPVGETDLALLRVFAANIAAGFENVDLIDTLARRNADLERFAFAAAHDLQEPLRKVAILSDLVVESEAERLSESGRDRLRSVHVSAAHMRKLVRGLLEYVTTSGDDFAPEDVELSEALDEAMAAVTVALEDCGARVDWGAPPAVRADRAALVRVFTLLLENAIAYRGAAPLQVRVSESRAGDEVTLAFADNGVGFDPARREEIFDAFKRLHRNAEIPGTGLGLSIARRLVEHQGGRLWAEGEPGVGATFYVALPAVRSFPRAA
jgi:signal transduction histidine kinase/CheY-like chemotaxis protein